MRNRGGRRLIWHSMILALVAVWAGIGLLGVSSAAAGTTERVGIFGDGIALAEVGRAPAVSGDGRYVAFWREPDIVVSDRAAGTFETVSEGFSLWPSISADGRYVAFASINTEVRGDTFDVFVRDRLAGVTERVSISSAGDQGSGYSGHPSISADGSRVAFDSDASNLVPDDTNVWAGTTEALADIFVRDRLTGTTVRVSVDSAGGQANGHSVYASISADGRTVAFVSFASNLVSDDPFDQEDVFVHSLGE